MLAEETVSGGRGGGTGGETFNPRVRAGDAKGVFGSVAATVALRGLRGDRTPVSARKEMFHG